MKNPVKNWLTPLLIVTIFTACKKQSFTNSADALLTTSADTLHFDTVFTTTGSVSQLVKIVNTNSKGIKINSVNLSGGAASAFKINVDGVPGPAVTNVEIAANDSAYIFVTVSINPSAINLPFVVRDSIEINYNGNKKWVQLDAFGRNANFLRNKIITANETWNNNRPYIILGSLIVEPNATLTINEGSKIYVHADAPIIVNGTLNVAGNFYDSTRVIFSGDRLDEPYRHFPASFPGIVFTATSKNNFLNYTSIKNAYQAVVVIGPASSGTKLTLNQTIIDNAYDAGILAINTSIAANNLLVSNCGKNILLVNGGNYNFTHCTSAAYSNSFLQHKDPVLGVSNFLSANGSTTVNNLSAQFRNCIFWGEGTGLVTSEVVIAKQGSNPFSVLFDGVLWRVPADPVNATITGSNIKNLSPLFDSVNTGNRFYNFRLKIGSPAINKGVATTVNIDLDGKPRPVGLPDLGAYEKQ